MAPRSSTETNFLGGPRLVTKPDSDWMSSADADTLIKEFPFNERLRIENSAYRSFAVELMIGHKLSNKLRLATLTHNVHPDSLSVFGLDSTYAFNHVQWTDHGLDHVRRMHRVMDGLISSMPDFFNQFSNPALLYAFELFPYFHDLDQLLTLMDNNIQERNGLQRKVKPKQGHAAAAAVMIMAMTDKYMRSSGMIEEERAAVEQITATAAIMMMKHDEPEKIDKAFSRKNKITGDELRDLPLKELIEGFIENKLDLFSLSRKQLMLVLRELKKDAIDPNDKITQYGLYREFAREYKPILEVMKNDDRPLFSNLDEESWRVILTLTQIAVFADKIEMIYPPFPSIMRCLNTNISNGRPWWDGRVSSDEMFRIIDQQEGNYTGVGDSDVRRLLWEALDSAKQISKKDTVRTKRYNIFSDDFAQSLGKEHVLMRIMALQEFGEGIMDNDSFNIVDDIYEDRSRVLGDKALRRIGSSVESTTFDNVVETIERSDYTYKEQLLDRYQFRVGSLLKEAAEMKKLIEVKKGRSNIRDFRQTCQKVLTKACDLFGIDLYGEEMARLREKFHLNINDFYNTYDPLGGVPDVWGEIPNEDHYLLWRQLINGDIRGLEYYDLRFDTLVDLYDVYKEGIPLEQLLFIDDTAQRYAPSDDEIPIDSN